jgi:hypothetical protein
MNDESFCGFPLRDMNIPGLRFSIEETYHAQKLVIHDKKGVLWEIRQILFSGEGEERVPLRISLYHRSSNGNPMHYQKRSAAANYNGVERLLLYIHHHEQFKSRGKRKWQH